MSLTYRENESVGTTYEALHAVDGAKAAFQLSYRDEQWKARFQIQNDGEQDVIARVQLRPIQQGPVSKRSTPQWCSYPEDTLVAGGEPQPVVIELSNQYEYRVQAKTTAGTSSVACWISPVEGDAA